MFPHRAGKQITLFCRHGFLVTKEHLLWLRYGWRGEEKRCGGPGVLAIVEADSHVVIVVVDPHEAVDDVNGHRENDGGVVLRRDAVKSLQVPQLNK